MQAGLAYYRMCVVTGELQTAASVVCISSGALIIIIIHLKLQNCHPFLHHLRHRPQHLVLGDRHPQSHLQQDGQKARQVELRLIRNFRRATTNSSVILNTLSFMVDHDFIGMATNSWMENSQSLEMETLQRLA